MIDLPRSARLAAWGSAALASSTSASLAVAAVTRDDEPHILRSEAVPPLPGEAASAGDLETLLRTLPRGTRMLLVLPAPGDPVGLPGPAAVNSLALEAGECVVLELPDLAQRWVLVPGVEEFGSPWEPGATVVWTLHAALPRRAPDAVSLADAERELRTALSAVTRALASMDVARWRDDAADRIAALRSGALPADAMPPGTDPRSLRVVHSAAQVLGIAELAGEDDGAAITGYEATARARALREVAVTARRALAVAVNHAGFASSGLV